MPRADYLKGCVHEMGILLLFFTTVFALIGCASNESRQNYASSVLSRPIPTTLEGKVQECNWIRSEIARQQSLAQYGASMATSPMMAMAYQAAARRNIAALESRASNVQCQSAFSSVVQSPVQGSTNNLNFDECFSNCQKLTDRTKDQCFDACK
jgi:hypothetical protein